MRSVPLIVWTPPGVSTVGGERAVLPHEMIARAQTMTKRRGTALGYLHAPVLGDCDRRRHGRWHLRPVAAAARIETAGVRLCEPGRVCPGSRRLLGAVRGSAG